MEITRRHVGERMSGVVIHGHTVYLSGQVPGNRNEGTGPQTTDVLSKIDQLLAEVGSDKSKILTATIYLADMRDFSAMNEAWDVWVDHVNAPARTTIEAKLASPTIRVEISIVAAC